MRQAQRGMVEVPAARGAISGVSLAGAHRPPAIERHLLEQAIGSRRRARPSREAVEIDG